MKTFAMFLMCSVALLGLLTCLFSETDAQFMGGATMIIVSGFILLALVREKKPYHKTHYSPEVSDTRTMKYGDELWLIKGDKDIIEHLPNKQLNNDLYERQS